MRFDKFTIKSQELVQEAQSRASSYKHQQIEPEHLLAVMLDDPNGIAGSILRKIGVTPDNISQELKPLLEKLPRVEGAAGEIYISQRTRKVLEKAFEEADQMKDQYVSIEHIFLAIVVEKQAIWRKCLPGMASN